MSEDKKTMPSEEELREAVEEQTAEANAEAGQEDTPETAEQPDNADSTEASDAAGDSKATDAAADDTKAEEAKESERYMRLMAEFQNYKKRTAKEKSDIHAYANEKIVTELLEVLDNFERALATDAAADPKAYVDGMTMIFNQMKDVLAKAGLKEVEAEGADFDPTRHNGVMMVDDPELGSGKVKQVLQKGYELNNKVIRTAMVMVTN